MSEPRPIQGSAGSRIRVILGNTGFNYLFLADHDDGNREYQTRTASGIPAEITKQLNNCDIKGRYIKEIDYGPTGSWFMTGIKRDGSGEHSWLGNSVKKESTRNGQQKVRVAFGRMHGSESFVVLYGKNLYRHRNVEPELIVRMDDMKTRDKKIKFVRLFDDGAFVISDEVGLYWSGLRSNVALELSKGGIVHDVAVASDGSWVVVRDDRCVCGPGIAPALKMALDGFYASQKLRQLSREREIKEYSDKILMEQFRIRQVVLASERSERERLQLNPLERLRADRERREQERMDSELAVKLKTVHDLEQQINHVKRALGDSLSALPPARRARISGSFTANESTPSESTSKEIAKCVICQDNDADIAIIPCGHQCLCKDCSTLVVGSLCPLCRGSAQSTLKIYNMG